MYLSEYSDKYFASEYEIKNNVVVQKRKNIKKTIFLKNDVLF